MIFLLLGFAWIILYAALLGQHAKETMPIGTKLDPATMLLHMTSWLQVLITGISLVGVGCVALYVAPWPFRCSCVEMDP